MPRTEFYWRRPIFLQTPSIMYLYQHVAVILLVTRVSISHGATEKDLGTERLARKAECREDVKVVQELCGLGEADLDNNWAVLDCIDKLPGEKKLSDACENTVWNFKVEITKKDFFLNQAKEICPDDDISVCEHEKKSEPGFLLACMVGKKQETKNLQCGKFLGQVRLSVVGSTE